MNTYNTFIKYISYYVEDLLKVNVTKGLMIRSTCSTGSTHSILKNGYAFVSSDIRIDDDNHYSPDSAIESTDINYALTSNPNSLLYTKITLFQ